MTVMLFALAFFGGSLLALLSVILVAPWFIKFYDWYYDWVMKGVFEK